MYVGLLLLHNLLAKLQLNKLATMSPKTQQQTQVHTAHTHTHIHSQLYMYVCGESIDCIKYAKFASASASASASALATTNRAARQRYPVTQRDM